MNCLEKIIFKCNLVKETSERVEILSHFGFWTLFLLKNWFLTRNPPNFRGKYPLHFWIVSQLEKSVFASLPKGIALVSFCKWNEDDNTDPIKSDN